jgi:hypothetical protein
MYMERGRGRDPAARLGGGEVRQLIERNPVQ